jgi:cell division protein ZapA
MAEVNVLIGGQTYSVFCRDGEEPHLTRLAAMVDAKANEARSAVGAGGDVRQLLLASLLLADELDEARAANLRAKAPDTSDEVLALERFADYVESLAGTLEKHS